MAGLCDALFQAPQRLTREGMAVIDTPRHGFWAALPHCEERPLTLFRFPRPVALFFRGQVVRQRPFQRVLSQSCFSEILAVCKSLNF